MVAPITLVAAWSVMAAAVRSEDEAGEEDHGDGEHHTCDDADPGGDGGQLGMAWFIAHGHWCGPAGRRPGR